jgi:hypothetical protein
MDDADLNILNFEDFYGVLDMNYNVDVLWNYVFYDDVHILLYVHADDDGDEDVAAENECVH